MKKHMGVIILTLLALIFLLISTITYVVDETRDIAVVTTFGGISKIVEGSKAPGLHWKWPLPIQKLTRYDSRDHVLISSYRQFSIGEKYNIMASAFCTWRIKNPRKFVEAELTAEKADTAIKGLLSSEMTGVIGKIKMEKLVNTDPKKMILPEIERNIKDRVAPQALEYYGIELTDVGIKTLGLPQSVSKAVITAMIEERSKEISKYQTEGKAVADAIVGRATAARKKILAFTDRQAADIRTRGESAAAEAYLQLREHPEFSMFLRSIESLRISLKSRTTFLLDSTTLPILKWLREKPNLKTFQESPVKRSEKK
ncbi:MAG: SPFH domain-containing protein [Phycisphaerae bacterium]|nr:SPFH domain-containing protein [Phycisphaerae bacterium]